jgi:hypothetical protein
MKRNFILSSLFLLFFVSCYDEIVYDENPFLNKRQELRFSELKLFDPVVTLGAQAEIRAIASGDSLVFSWSAPEGHILVKDTAAFFFHDTEGFYLVICQVTDKYGASETKEVIVHVTPELVFTGLSAELDTIPQNYRIAIEAIASGEELVYEWNASGGALEGDGKKVFFRSETPGTFILSCTVTDLAGESQTTEIEITVVEGFIFKSLTADPERIRAHDNSYLTASAIGNNLSYNWSCDPPAVLLGEGPNIIFNICHADVFTVTCVITDDQGNSKSKTVRITVTDL